MYGVPIDLSLQPFVGRAFNQISLGRFDTQFRCAGAGSLHVEGRWELRDGAGELTARDTDDDQADIGGIRRLLDVPIVAFEVDAPRSFTIVFADGHRLSVFDESEQYESFSLHLDGQPALYV